MKENKVPFNAPLHQLDSETQTYGCRADPRICRNCYLPKVCAFVCEDGVCKQPSKKWAKQYQKLKEQNS